MVAVLPSVLAHLLEESDASMDESGGAMVVRTHAGVIERLRCASTPACGCAATGRRSAYPSSDRSDLGAMDP